MDYEYLRIEHEGPVAVLRFHRPDVVYAFHGPMAPEKEEAFLSLLAGDAAGATRGGGRG
ncbi:MAG: hypothetical protein ABIK65_07165 [Candidatus Eisenbacteria bacterium]